jgi:hypothetical protein
MGYDHSRFLAKALCPPCVHTRNGGRLALRAAALPSGSATFATADILAVNKHAESRDTISASQLAEAFGIHIGDFDDGFGSDGCGGVFGGSLTRRVAARLSAFSWLW